MNSETEWARAAHERIYGQCRKAKRTVRFALLNTPYEIKIACVGCVEQSETHQQPLRKPE